MLSFRQLATRMTQSCQRVDAAKSSLRSTVREEKSPTKTTWNSLIAISVTLGVAMAILCGGEFGTELLAQGTKAKGKKGEEPAKAAVAEVEVQELPNLNFESVYQDADQMAADPDDTPEGQARLNEVVRRAKEIYREYENIERERRPLAGPRDVMVGEMLQLATGINQANATIIQLNKQIADLNNQMVVTNNAGLKSEIASRQATISVLQQRIQFSNSEIAARQPKVAALNAQIKPLDDRLRKLWEELNACRKQWLELRVPVDKYNRADFERLKIVIDEWLRVDGLWPQAFCFGALCAFEMGDYEKASDLVERADKLREEVIYSRREWPQILALRGLVTFRAAGQRSRASTILQKAISSLEKTKDTDWETSFVIGRALADKDGQESRAMAFFERTLKIKPNCLCAKHWMSRIQTTTSNKKIQDLEGGIKLLESVWSRTGKRSWRISFDLVRAYDNAKRKDAADQQWEVTLRLAPSNEHADLRKQRGI